MAEALILKSGGGFDDAEVSARPENVTFGKKFLGRGSDEPQIGTVAIIPKITVKLGINEKYTISPGYHGGEDVVSQSGIKIEEGPIISPTAGGQIVQLSGKVLTSDTYIQGIENLRPEVIKDGVIIADVVGNYQGFLDGV